MAKKVQAYVKLQVAAGMANPSPPVGPALGQQGVNIMEFCKAFNAKTDSMEKGLPIPVERFAEFHDVHALLTQCWTYRRTRVSHTSCNLQLDVGLDFLSHSKFL